MKALTFFKDVIDELKKLHVPSRKENNMTTLIILVVVFISSLMIMFADFLISKIIKILFGLGA